MVDIELYSNMPVCFWLKKENKKKNQNRKQGNQEGVLVFVL